MATPVVRPGAVGVPLSLPVFTLNGYADLILKLRGLGYALHPASEIHNVKGRAVFLRHDVDLHLEGALDVTAVEEGLGVRSTWYVGTRLAYNPAFAPNAEVIRALASHGHTIGLHYLSGQEGVSADLELLESLSRSTVETWVMHEPSAGGVDHHMCKVSPYTTGNPHAYGLHYVSDSGMRWRDPWISELLAGTHDRVMLNTHHEHWLGRGDRARLAPVIAARALEPTERYLDHLLSEYGA